MKKNNPNKCATKYCRRDKKQGKVCCRCYWRKVKADDIVRYTYYYVKNNAKRRKKEFLITLHQFREFCEESGYIESKGKQRWSMSIDRIDNEKGYSIDNIRLLSLGLNSAKGSLDLSDVPF